PRQATSGSHAGAMPVILPKAGFVTILLAMSAEADTVTTPAAVQPTLDVLVIDDERNIRTTLRVCLEGAATRVVDASTAQAAKMAVARQSFDLAFLDLRLGDSNGLTLIPALLASSPLIDIVVVTAYGTVENAVEAIQLGARDVLQKPFTPDQIRAVVEKT